MHEKLLAKNFIFFPRKEISKTLIKTKKKKNKETSTYWSVTTKGGFWRRDTAPGNDPHSPPLSLFNGRWASERI